MPKLLPPTLALFSVLLCNTTQASPYTLLPQKTFLGGSSFFTVDAPPLPANTPHNLITFRILVQRGLETHAQDFAKTTVRVLEDPEGWNAAGIQLKHVHQNADLTVLLARGKTVDKLCKPLDTGGVLSCGLYGRAHLNLYRWTRGSQSWGDDLTGYRSYLISHEIGHLLGMPHWKCPGRGQKAPVMMQQTKRVSPCVPSGKPSPEEVEKLRQKTPTLLQKIHKRRKKKR